MMLHETGFKSQRDRSMLVASYRDMAKEFKVPRKERITAAQMSKMTNRQLHCACRDLYNGVTVEVATAYGIKRGIIKKPRKSSFMMRVRNFLRKVVRHG